jgi:hypothetical protein
MRASAWCMCAVWLLCACPASKKTEGCSEDASCEAGFVCQKDLGVCRCQTDDACGAGFYCNSGGVCQVRPPCIGNSDCSEGFLCNSSDPSGGRCIPLGTCGSSVHCEFNYYCEPTQKVCVEGCRGTGDCQLGYVCSNGRCTSGVDAEACSACPVRPAPDASYCDYGEVCSASGACVAHAQKGSLCQECTATQNCAAGLTCLVDDETTGSYCAPACKTQSDCPSGYDSCGGVTLVSAFCSKNADCGGTKRCLGGSEVNRGFCECQTDTDCGFSPLCLSGKCLASGLACASNADCATSCVQMPVGDGTTVGVCETKARVCGKAPGVTCRELTRDPAYCSVLNQP